MKIEEIPKSILSAVRQRIGADDEYDTQLDGKIQQMTPQQLMEKWCGWHLGDEGWGVDIISKYEHLKKIEDVTKDRGVCILEP